MARQKIYKKNIERSTWALSAVELFMAETGLTDDDGMDTAMSDLLADMMHLCDVQGVSFESVLEQAKFHYGYELKHPNE